MLNVEVNDVILMERLLSDLSQSCFDRYLWKEIGNQHSTIHLFILRITYDGTWHVECQHFLESHDTVGLTVTNSRYE